jgi:hypothetical protein
MEIFDLGEDIMGQINFTKEVEEQTDFSKEIESQLTG